MITTSPKIDLGLRLSELAKDLEQVLQTYQPDCVAIESLFFFKNYKTVITVAEARGVILLTVIQQGIPILELTPLQVKLALTGDGRASKDQVQTMVQKIFNLAQRPEPDDAADALAIAYTAY